MSSAAADAQQGDKGEARGRLVQYLKDFKRYTTGLDGTTSTGTSIRNVPITKTRAMKQWYVKATDLADLPVTKDKKSSFYCLQDVIRAAEERHGTASLYELVFDSKEAFQMVSKKEAAEDKYFHKYRDEKKKMFSLFLREKVAAHFKEASEQYGPCIAEEAQNVFLEGQEAAITMLKAKWKQCELEYDAIEEELERSGQTYIEPNRYHSQYRVKPTEVQRRAASKFGEIFRVQMELRCEEAELQMMKKTLSTLLFDEEVDIGSDTHDNNPLVKRKCLSYSEKNANIETRESSVPVNKKVRASIK